MFKGVLAIETRSPCVPRYIQMLVNKSGMRAGDTANIVGESGGSKTQWKLDNKRSVQKDQEGAAWTFFSYLPLFLAAPRALSSFLGDVPKQLR